MVAIPDNDVADAHGDADPAGTFDLRAADLDRIAVTNVSLDRRRQPWRRPSTRNERSCAGIAANPQLILLLVIRPNEHIQRADGWCVESLVTILRCHQTCPVADSISVRQTSLAIAQ